MTHNPLPERLLELLADREICPLSPADQTELDALLAEHPDADDGSLEAAAVALMLGSLGEIEPMPESVRAQVTASLAPADAALRLTEAPEVVTKPRALLPAWSGWLAAAACLIVAVLVGVARNAPPDPARAVARFSPPDLQVSPWADWDNPEIPGVSGEVRWSEAEQEGYMTFTGLAVNNPTAEQYQLWIIDERGMNQRISGAIFDCDSTGRCVVRIDPAIEIHNAAAFAVTIEQPGGTWVSDMSRRVVIASLSS